MCRGGGGGGNILCSCGNCFFVVFFCLFFLCLHDVMMCFYFVKSNVLLAFNIYEQNNFHTQLS